MISLSMATHVEHLVLHISPTFSVEAEDLVVESLPLSLCMIRVVLVVSVIRSVDQTKVGSVLRSLLSAPMQLHDFGGSATYSNVAGSVLGSSCRKYPVIVVYSICGL